jgi:hypothetical protein
MIEETKESFIETVKIWIQTDNQIKLLNTKLKELRTEKKKQNENMISVMKENGIDIFNLKDGQIQYKKEKTKKPLSQVGLLKILSKHPQLGEEQAKSLNEFIYEQREDIIRDTIIRKGTSS